MTSHLIKAEEEEAKISTEEAPKDLTGADIKNMETSKTSIKFNSQIHLKTS